MQRPYQRLHDVAPRQSLARSAFIISFLLGIGGSILLKALDVHPFIVAAYAALALVFYALASWYGGSIRLEPENIGDNCYYLGFLFTLGSLAYTLYQMADPGLNNSQAVNIPDVISGFGVALSSTIVGVFLRVLLMQMRPDFVAREREIQADVNKSYIEFRKQMSSMLRQMKAFSAESVQIAAERDERMRKETEQFVKDHHQELMRASEEFNRRVAESFSSVVEVVLGRVETAFSNSSARSAEVVAEASQRAIEAIGVTRKQILDMKNALREQEMETLKDVQERRRLIYDALAAEEDRLAKHSAELETLIKATRRTADVMGKKLATTIEDRVIPAMESVVEKLEKSDPAKPGISAAVEVRRASDPPLDLASVSETEAPAEKTGVKEPLVATRSGPWSMWGKS